MIKANKGLVQLHGNNSILLAELSCIARALYEATEKEEEKSVAEALIRQVVEIGLDDAKTAEKQNTNLINVPNKELKSVLIDLISKVFGEDKKDE